MIVHSKDTLLEFGRYILVGGTAFIADVGSLVAFRELVFPDCRYGVYISVLIAFFIGHVVSYLGSLWFVFLDPDERRKGWTWRSFWLFTIVGAIGVAMTEFGMWVGCDCIGLNYIVTKVVVAAIVLLWNFAGRKMVVLKRGGGR